MKDFKIKERQQVVLVIKVLSLSLTKKRSVLTVKELSQVVQRLIKVTEEHFLKMMKFCQFLDDCQ